MDKRSSRIGKGRRGGLALIVECAVDEGRPSVRSKTYWNKDRGGADPFEIPKRVASGIEACQSSMDEDGAVAHPLRYIWMYITEAGLRQDGEHPQSEDLLGLDGWLNVIDESASLGAEWMVVYVGASLSQVPYIWEVCAWAQGVHGLRVGLHLTSNCLSEDDIERLSRLDPQKTYIVADKAHLASLRFLESKGIRLCEANVRATERDTYCTKPEEMACVGADGRLFSCGLVLGDERYAMVNYQDRSLHDVKSDESLSHAVPDTSAFPPSGCDACPPLMAMHALDKEAP